LLGTIIIWHEIHCVFVYVAKHFCHGRYDWDTFWNNVLARFDLSPDRQLNPRTLSAAYLKSYQLYPEVLKTARQLQKKYRVGLLSNLTPEMRDHIKKIHHTSRYFPTEIYSCDPDVQMFKPATKIFRLAARKMQALPSACLFIDDSKKNVAAAKKLGMQTILFKTPEQFLKSISPLL
jgi:HAD superfamily hydrolase (TIGR01509 family)